MTAEASKFRAIGHLKNGLEVEIRALRPSDEASMLAALDRSSGQSVRRRFFQIRRHFSKKESDYYLNVDFITHVALVATTKEGERDVIIGGARYIVVEPGVAESAFTVIDQYQGQGVGKVLFTHLVSLARQAGMREMVADVLSENAPMLGLFKRSGLVVDTKRSADVVHVKLQL
jgi:GNAT superfamily N-acetyltransferase